MRSSPSLRSAAAARRVFVAGGHTTQFLGKGNPAFVHPKHPDFGKKENPSLRDYLTESISGALKTSSSASSSAAAVAELVDRVYVGNFAGELFAKQGHLGAAVAGAVEGEDGRSSGLLYKPSMRIEGACASGGLAVAAAVDALRVGAKGGGADVALVCGAEVQNTVSAREGGTFLARAADFERQAGIDDFAFPCLLARRAKAYLEKYTHLTMDNLNAVVLKAFSNGNKNPKAHMHSVKLDPETGATLGERNPNFLSNETYHSFVRMRDCSQVSDGGSAIVLCNEQGALKLGIASHDSKLVEIVGVEYGCGNLYDDPADLTTMDTAAAVAKRLLERTGGKIADVDVLEVHDCFSIAEVLMYEAVGLAEAGEGCELAKSGATQLNGSVPVNTGGGLLAFGHPVGATGVKQIHELYRQIMGECGEYQILGKEVKTGLAMNMGGDDKTIVATMLRKT
mmetsp:Transcript_22462/g.56768  ORF Transcript_22462/g.56768 Transcript_22462/m.56768 type:complete len:453 (-) Transcript_22462:306-1664(-)|eukprot:CAMPEP_0178999776 /NCGR_PEP_ID=MMETSP0795-20121207/10275_1 /TAXON_ID=88552 /ORGANISM="Amoebophrya sp., Strain Ameob2" /LENGTH=452 /DNA_ID=CAMNT_0020692641 /DNA_START=39 /DNA_END=1397 /DNA_ORIENTATION=-